MRSDGYEDFVARFTALTSNFPYQVKIGCELEFYIDAADPLHSQRIMAILTDKLAAASDLFDELKPEKGRGQYEICWLPTFDLIAMGNVIIAARAIAAKVATMYNSAISFESKPKAEDYGSAMQFHVSLHSKDGGNIFAKSPNDPESPMLMSVVAGLLATLKQHYSQFIATNADKKRLDGNFMAPTTLSWGKNNRTTMLRIPASSDNRRIEHRLAGSNASPWRIMLALLAGIEHGVGNNLVPPTPIYGNAYDSQYYLEALDLSK